MTGGHASGQITVLDDNFESGSFSSDWDAFDAQVFTEFAGGPNSYAHIQGASDGGAGVTLTNLDGSGSSGATDFQISLDFRINPVETDSRMFNLMVNGDSPTPTATGSALNLRYYNDTWQTYNGSAWDGLALPAITPDTWHSLSVVGTNWGSGIVGGASYDISLNGTTTLSGLQTFQNDADAKHARSVAFNDRWESPTNGFDIDNVLISATPGAALPPNTTTIVPTAPVAYSGIYAHTAVTNTHNEVAVGALLKRDDTVWFVTYGPHVTRGGTDELYSVDLNTLEFTTWHDYPGNTDANRYTDNNLGIDVIGAAYIDHATETVRYLPVTNVGAGDLVGRITGTSAHLTDPNKLYYATMEEGLYEVDFSDLANPVITTLRSDGNHDNQGGIQKNLPGVHGKGLFTGQGHLYFTNNGAGQGGAGGLVEWDGTGDPEQLSSWTVVDDTAQYTEVTSRQGPVDMDPNSTDAIWATGWDDASMFINTRDADTGEWTKFRTAKSSYTHGHPNGWYTEWPRIRDVGLEGGYLMSHHGMMFLVPETFDTDSYGGLTPLASHHKMIVDYVEDGDRIIFAGNDASKQLGNNILPKANSNIFFVDKDNLADYGGKPKGFGGVWVNQDVDADTASDAFLIAGFRDRVIHFEHENDGTVNYTLEVDANGDGNWANLAVVSIDGTAGANQGYGYYLLPQNVDAQWLRIKADQDVASSTAYLHLGNGAKATNTAQLASLADVAAPAPRSQGLLRSTNEADFKLEYAADRLDAAGNIVGTGYYRAQLNPATAALELVFVDDAAAEANVRNAAATTQDFFVDAASVYIDDGGTRFRLPKGAAEFDTATASGWRRGEREVVTERNLLNVHGTFYELPKDFTGGGFERIVPITTHNLDIYDFMSWRGMLVLSGVVDGGAADGHYLQSDDGQVGLWFGNVDDLWSFGAPQGVGGPWKDTAVTAGAASDPYLMAGYDQKLLELSHDADDDVTFTVEVDFLGTGQWEIYDNLTVAAGQTLAHLFPEGYSSHWVRFVSDTDTTATAWLTYALAASILEGDYNADGVVSQPDLDLVLLNWGVDTNASGIPEGWVNHAGIGSIGQAELDAVLLNWGNGSGPSARLIPEPGAFVAILAGAVPALFRRSRVTC